MSGGRMGNTSIRDVELRQSRERDGTLFWAGILGLILVLSLIKAVFG